MLKVWGRPNSINVQKVMWAVGELGLEIEHIMAGGQYGGNNETWYLAMNPNGKVPLLVLPDGIRLGAADRQQVAAPVDHVVPVGHVAQLRRQPQSLCDERGDADVPGAEVRGEAAVPGLGENLKEYA